MSNDKVVQAICTKDEDVYYFWLSCCDRDFAVMFNTLEIALNSSPNFCPFCGAKIETVGNSLHTFDDKEFNEMVEKGTKAWANVPDTWLEDLRGNPPPRR